LNKDVKIIISNTTKNANNEGMQIGVSLLLWYEMIWN